MLRLLIDEGFPLKIRDKFRRTAEVCALMLGPDNPTREFMEEELGRVLVTRKEVLGNYEREVQQRQGPSAQASAFQQQAAHAHPQSNGHAQVQRHFPYLHIRAKKGQALT